MKFDRGGKKESKKEKKKREEDDDWKGSEDVEKLCMIFTNYLTSAANTSWKGDETAKSKATDDKTPKSSKKSKKSRSKSKAEPDEGFTEQAQKEAD